METVAWYKSPTAIAAIAAIAGGLVGFSHFLCIYFGVCIFDKISLDGWTLAIGGLCAIIGGAYSLYRRFKAGLDPENPLPKLTLK